jgi:3-oxoacyl-[acyl-carrier-protein] synthase II
MSRRRVVVTGLGCVSPVGNTAQASWAQILAGQSGIDVITHFDASAFACHFAGEVKNFNLDEYISPKEARTMDRGCWFASGGGCWFAHRRRFG